MIEIEALTWLESLLTDNPARISHSRAVAEAMVGSARLINSLLEGSQPPLDEQIVRAAGLLHDIGYAAALSRTGFHPVDGYNFLYENKNLALAEIIVGHSSAAEEGNLKGFIIVTSNHIIAKLLTYWDTRIGPSGQRMAYEERLSEIESRYGSDHPVTIANLRSRCRVDGVIAQVEEVLTGHRIPTEEERFVDCLNCHLLPGLIRFRPSVV